MTIKVNYSKKKISKFSSSLVIFSNEKFDINTLKKNLSNAEFNYINDLLNTKDTKKKLFKFDINSKKKIILVSVKNNSQISDIENLGAEFYSLVNQGKNSEYFIISDSLARNNKKFLGHFLHGIKLKSYAFEKYKSKKNKRLIIINVVEGKSKISNQTNETLIFGILSAFLNVIRKWSMIEIGRKIHESHGTDF